MAISKAADFGPVQPAEMTETGPGIYYTDRPFVLVDDRIVDALKAKAAQIAVRRARLCAHPSSASIQHDMLIAIHRDTYIAPHRHFGKSETFLMLEGLADILLFEENGRLADVVRMGPQGSGHAFFYRMPEGLYHSLSLQTEMLVYVESTSGPFDPAQTEFAPWAPGGKSVAEGHAYLANLLRQKESVS